MADTNIDYQDQLNRANTLHDQLNKMYDENRAQVTTAEAQTKNLNKQSQAAYKQQQIESQKAQNQFAQNQQANQLSALDAIRRSNASAIANGANAGLSAANQLSAILGLQEDTSKAATDLANTDIDNAAKLNTQLNENAAKGQQMANELNATLDANAAELAKSLATNADSITNLIEGERQRKAQEEQARLDRESQERIAGVQKQTDTQGNEITTNTEQEKIKLQQEADKKAALTQRRDSIVEGLTNLTANFQGGDAHTFVTSYYDPFEDKTVTVSGEGMQKRQTDDIINKLNAKIKEAYDSGDEAAIKLWTDRAAKFSSELKYQDDACLAPGTLITLADGSTKAVEDIKAGDELLVWDMVRGAFDHSPVLFVEHDEEAEKEVIRLDFSDDTEIEFIFEHGFFDINANKYVYLHNLEEAKTCIGHYFLKYDPDTKKHTKVKVIKASAERRITTTHSPCTIRHLCVYANGLLTMPGATAPFTNTFKINRKTHSYDPNDMIRRLRRCGYFTAIDFAEYLPAEMFYAFQGEFLKVKIAKGETSLEEILALIKRYAQYLI